MADNDTIQVTAATVANMKAYREKCGPMKQVAGEGSTVHMVAHPVAFAYSPLTGQRVSAGPGDYFMAAEDEPLLDDLGEPMILVTSRTVYYDALTGEAI